MTCDEARALFSDVADERLTSGEKAPWDAHLATCPDCRHEWGSFQRTLGLLQDLPRHRAPTGFVDRVMVAAYPQPWPRRLARRLFVPLRVKVPLQAAALVFLVLTATYLLPRTPELQQAMRDTGPPSDPPVPAAPPPSAVEPVSPAPSPASPPPQPAVPRKDRLGVLARPESKARADRSMVEPESTGEKAAESGPVPAPRSIESRTPEARPAPEAPAPSREFFGGRPAPRQERVRTTAAAAPVVMGRLAVEDRDAGQRALAALIARVGATELARASTGDGTLIELDVPRAHYAEFIRGLAGIGGWTPGEERVAPGPEVRVRIVVGPSAR